MGRHTGIIYKDQKLNEKSVLYGYSMITVSKPVKLVGIRKVAEFVLRNRVIGAIYVYDTGQQLVFYTEENNEIVGFNHNYLSLLRPVIAGIEGAAS